MSLYTSLFSMESTDWIYLNIFAIFSNDEYILRVKLFIVSFFWANKFKDYYKNYIIHILKKTTESTMETTLWDMFHLLIETSRCYSEVQTQNGYTASIKCFRSLLLCIRKKTFFFGKPSLVPFTKQLIMVVLYQRMARKHFLDAVYVKVDIISSFTLEIYVILIRERIMGLNI